MEKGDQKAVFDVPSNFLSDRYKSIGTEVTSRFGDGERIPVKNIAIPNLSVPMSLARDEPFSLFVPRHRRIAARLIDIFMGKCIDALLYILCYEFVEKIFQRFLNIRIAKR